MRLLTLTSLLGVVATIACTAEPPAAPVAQDGPAVVAADGSQNAWWARMQALCGAAFSGTLAHGNESDAAFAGQPMVMHVRRCRGDRMEIPFHVGEDRSRTWVLTRSSDGLLLKHDHRHQDGSEDASTMYGGHTESPGTEVAQFFPADLFSREMFVAQGIPQSADNVWSMEIVPGERFSYVLRRPNRHFQVDFDLTTPVEPPPAPWGHE